METLTIKTDAFSMTEEEFFRFCEENKDLRIEKEENQNIILMSPTGIETSEINSELNLQLRLWNKSSGLGKVFDSNAGFTLPNRAVRSPDSSWLSNDLYQKLSIVERQRFPHICPEFLIELRSPSDSLKVLKLKMKEWMDNGCNLAWLIDPEERTVHIYRKDGSIEIRNFAEQITGEEVLPGFVLDVGVIEEILK